MWQQQRFPDLDYTSDSINRTVATTTTTSTTTNNSTQS